MTDRPLIASGSQSAGQLYHVIFAPPGEGVPLRTRRGLRGVALSTRVEYAITGAEAGRGSHRVSTTAYAYRILDPDWREILAYHWHPAGGSQVVSPHLHLTSRVRPIDLGPGLDPVALADMHLPTGPVGFADIVRLLITEFGVAPRRDDWEAILSRDPGSS